MPERLDGSDSDRLVCVECASRADDAATHWRAYLSSDAEVVIFCPACAGREFGDATSASGDGGER